MNRRSFLKVSGCALAAATTGVHVTAQSSSATHVFVDESGIFGSQDPFVIGLLVSPNPERVIREITRLRARHAFTPQLRYDSADPKRLPFADALIQYFFDRSQATFHALVGSKTVSIDRRDRDAFATEYCYFYLAALRDVLRPGVRATVHLRKHWRGGLLDQRLIDCLKRELPNVVVNQTDRMNQMVQFADFLTGNIRGDANSVTGPGKQQLIGALKKRLGMTSLRDPRLAEHRSFRVRVRA
jgi:hypothetical protein